MNRPRLLLATIVVALSLTSCATTHAPAAEPIETPAPLAVSVPMPDLGPAPPRDQLTDEQVEAMRLEQRDAAWERTLGNYPNAVRPDVAFEGYLAPEDRNEVLSACYTEVGLPVEYSTNADGTDPRIGTSYNTEAQAIGFYVCEAKHPFRPIAPPNAAQLAWIYDYLTQFLVPCYEANGVENPPAPTREDFIANWPNQNWFPSTGSMMMGSPEELAVVAACPPPA